MTQAVSNHLKMADRNWILSSHSNEQGHFEYKQSVTHRDRNQEREKEPEVIHLRGRSSRTCRVITSIYPNPICALGSSSVRRETLCVCVLWLISVGGKWKPLKCHFSLFRKTCHSPWTRCHLHNLNQNVSHCLTRSCRRILIWGLYSRLSWILDRPGGQNSTEFLAKSSLVFQRLGLQLWLITWDAVFFIKRAATDYSICYINEYTSERPDCFDYLNIKKGIEGWGGEVDRWVKTTPRPTRKNQY